MNRGRNLRNRGAGGDHLRKQGEKAVARAVDQRGIAEAMTTLFLVRHGRTGWNKEQIFRGTKDVPLDAVGREEALMVGERLKGEGLRAVSLGSQEAIPRSLPSMAANTASGCLPRWGGVGCGARPGHEGCGGDHRTPSPGGGGLGLPSGGLEGLDLRFAGFRQCPLLEHRPGYDSSQLLPSSGRQMDRGVAQRHVSPEGGRGEGGKGGFLRE